MEGIREIAAVFSAVCLLSCGLGILSSGKLGRSAEYIFSLILLLSIIGAAVSADFGFSIDSETGAETAGGYEEELSRYQAEYICRSILDGAGIKYGKITARATKNDDGSIIINEIIIRDADNAEKAKTAVLESGVTDRVTIE